ncbi:hypothetical protein, partial [Mesorhizobium sp.]|uniref:hypothetical protein n=1 Tax=Mesorhizobium sp. TaxID=1871066 RepID=UPI0025DCF2EA
LRYSQIRCNPGRNDRILTELPSGTKTDNRLPYRRTAFFALGPFALGFSCHPHSLTRQRAG